MKNLLAAVAMLVAVSTVNAQDAGMQSVLAQTYGQPQVQQVAPIFPRLAVARSTARTCVDGVCTRAASGVRRMQSNVTTRVRAYQGRRAAVRQLRGR